MLKKKLPIGIDNFEKLRLADFYYVDKTGLIKSLLQSWGAGNTGGEEPLGYIF